MQNDLQHWRNKRLGDITEIECCYQIVLRYLGVIEKRGSKYEFGSAEDEIHFFKIWKPKFISELFYYELLYHLELFKPKENKDIRTLLLREQNRFPKFIWTHPDFYEYYKNGSNARDAIYFTRCNCNIVYNKNPSVFSFENDVGGYDDLIARAMALERYDEYVNKKLKEFTGEIS